ncbi:MAG: alginate O-acetyltransferase AlgX-related protein [Pseudoclavibacter sp.]
MPSTAVPHDRSPVFFPVGLTSANGVVVLGHDGYMFVKEGTNGAFDQYRHFREHPDEADAIVERWGELFAARAARLERMGIGYLQTILPEKSSVLPGLVPDEFDQVDGVGPLLAALNARHTGTDSWYINAFRSLQRYPSAHPFYPRTGSHWTPAGARAFASRIVEAFRPGVALRLDRVPLATTFGIDTDLAKHLFDDLTPVELAPAAREADLPWRGEVREVARRRTPGGSITGVGSMTSWDAPNAPIRKRVLMFGASSMQTNPMPDRLSWWMRGAFAQTRFVWSPSFDWDMIDEYAPDVVIGQGLERFLVRVPEETERDN